MLSRLTASQASTEHTRIFVIGSRRGGMFQRYFFAGQVRERRQSGWIKVVGHWFESGRCVVALKGNFILFYTVYSVMKTRFISLFRR